MAINDPKILFKTALTDVVASGKPDSEQVGTIRHGLQGNIYRWVQNTHTVDLVLGDVVFHNAEDDGVNMNKYVEDGATEELMFMAGVALAAIPSSGFGWIQIKGVNAAVNHLGGTSGGTATAIGDSLIGVATKVYGIRSTAVGTAPIYVNTIIALEAVATVSTSTTTAATISGLIRCF